MNTLTVEECQKISILNFNFKHVYVIKITLNSQSVHLSYSRCYYGGKRYWFLCPKCNKQVGTLYRKPMHSLFFCRSCQNLTYQLTKYRRSTSEGFLKLLHSINPINKTLKGSEILWTLENKWIKTKKSIWMTFM